MEAPGRYTVELHLPASGWVELRAAADRARQASDEMRRDGTNVRFLRSLFVPETDACFFLYEGPSARAVRAAADRAALGVQQVRPVLTIDPTPERGPK